MSTNTETTDRWAMARDVTAWEWAHRAGLPLPLDGDLKAVTIAALDECCALLDLACSGDEARARAEVQEAMSARGLDSHAGVDWWAGFVRSAEPDLGLEPFTLGFAGRMPDLPGFWDLAALIHACAQLVTVKGEGMGS